MYKILHKHKKYIFFPRIRLCLGLLTPTLMLINTFKWNLAADSFLGTAGTRSRQCSGRGYWQVTHRRVLVLWDCALELGTWQRDWKYFSVWNIKCCLFIRGSCIKGYTKQHNTILGFFYPRQNNHCTCPHSRTCAYRKITVYKLHRKGFLEIGYKLKVYKLNRNLQSYRVYTSYIIYDSKSQSNRLIY